MFSVPLQLQDKEEIMGLLTILLFIAVNLIIHEAAHAVAMERNGIRLKEMGIFFPLPGIPRLAVKIGKNRILTINHIPLGAYVKPADEEAINALPYFQKAQVFGAGVLANLIFGCLLLGILTLTGGLEVTRFASLGVPWVLAISFGGIVLFFLIRKYFSLALPFLGLACLGFIIWSLTILGFGGTFMGPIGIVSLGAGLKSFDMMLLLGFGVSIGIGLINMLPFAPLDGGQALVALLQKYFGKREKLERFTTAAGAVFVIFLLITVTLCDIERLLG